MNPVQIAEVCHEANRALQRQLGEVVNFPWENTSQALRDSGIAGVEKALRGWSPDGLHESWCEERANSGWVYGAVKDFAAKTHPCLVPYDELPEAQKTKDRLFQAVVAACTDRQEF